MDIPAAEMSPLKPPSNRRKRRWHEAQPQLRVTVLHPQPALVPRSPGWDGQSSPVLLWSSQSPEKHQLRTEEAQRIHTFSIEKRNSDAFWKAINSGFYSIPSEPQGRA